MDNRTAAPASQTIALSLASFVNDLVDGSIPEEVRARARYLILDAVGIALASTQYEFARVTLAAMREFGGGDSNVIGFGDRLALRDAIALNGTLVHGLDYDDTHTRGVIHGTASCFPTALGVAAASGASGRELLTAYIAGMEVGARLASVAKGGFHQTGFHPTGLVGTFACALVAGRLRKLSAEQLGHAQGIALSLASGSLEFLQDGAWTKRFHPGWAGAAGVTAAALARNGFVGPQATYEGRFGLYASYLGTLPSADDLAIATDNLGKTWELMEVAVKPLPACHFTHAFADAATSLREKHGIRPEQVAGIRALVPAEVVKTVCEPVQNKVRPQNSYDAQFSVPFAIASGLSRGRFGLHELEPGALSDPTMLGLAAKVAYEVDPNSAFPKYYSGEVIVTLADGRVLSHREHVNRGSADRPLSADEITAKFLQNAEIAVSNATAERILETVMHIDSIPTAELSAGLSCRS